MAISSSHNQADASWMDGDEGAASDRTVDGEESSDDTYYSLTDWGALGGGPAGTTGHST